MRGFDRYFVMKNSATGRDPLATTAVNAFRVSERIFIIDTPVKHISYRFDSAMRMPLISFGIIRRCSVIEGVEHEERIEVFGVSRSNDTQ